MNVQCCDLREWGNAGLAGGPGFDHVVANPPFLPFPEEMAYSVAGHGGNDGLRLTWRILELLPGILTPAGTAQIIGTGLSNGTEPMFLDRLNDCARSHGLRILLTIMSHQPLKPGSELFDRMVFSATYAVGGKISEIASKFDAFLGSQGPTHLCSCFFHATRGRAAVEHQDLSNSDRRMCLYDLLLL